MIEIVRTGSQICIVDSGRYGYRRYGVPLSGAMDLRSAASANSILHNRMDAALLELYMPGHQFLFHTNTAIALTGAQAEMYLDASRVYTDRLLTITAGSTLSIGAMSRGSRIYMAVLGGCQTSSILGSRSPILGYFPRTLFHGDKIPISDAATLPQKSAIISTLKIQVKQRIKCSHGPEWHFLTKGNQQQISAKKFVIDSKSDRMGYRLEGDMIKSKKTEIYSSAVMPGTIQLLPSGLPIILMRDCQTTGGYPRILQVTEEDINQLGQRKPGDDIQFEIVNSSD